MTERQRWRKVGELIARWAQDDGNADELSDLRERINLHKDIVDFEAPGYDEQEDQFWAEFNRRLARAFGKEKEE